MQRNKLFTGMCAAILLFVAFSCKKDADGGSSPKTKAELLAQNTWKFDNIKVGGVDASGFLQDCEKDNTLKFVADGTGTADEGATKCDASDPQTVPFTWVFQTNETQIKANVPLFNLGNDTFTIVTLSDTQLVVSQDVDFGGTTQNAVVTFKK